MSISRYISYVLILIGALVAIYAKAGENQNQMLLIGGIVALMLGIYRISRGIPSKTHKDETNQKDD